MKPKAEPCFCCADRSGLAPVGIEQGRPAVLPQPRSTRLPHRRHRHPHTQHTRYERPVFCKHLFAAVCTLSRSHNPRDFFLTNAHRRAPLHPPYRIRHLYRVAHHASSPSSLTPLPPRVIVGLDKAQFSSTKHRLHIFLTCVALLGPIAPEAEWSPTERSTRTR